MRKTFSTYLEKIAAQDKDIVFITGDLGFNALENLREMMGERFINAGVAEQHMVGLAAGLASKGKKVFVYSIAPFIVYRALEQVRNDVCFHNLPVCFVGNGGGYGYGIMGSSHHAIEDLAVMSCLPNMKCYVPTFGYDVENAIDDFLQNGQPSYLRLGLAIQKEKTDNCWNLFETICENPESKLTVISQGPVSNNLMSHSEFQNIKDKIDFFVIKEMPLNVLPSEIEKSIRKTQKVLVFDEHVVQGGLVQTVAFLIAKSGIQLTSFDSICAVGYPDGKYGSQKFHYRESGLDGEGIVGRIKIALK